jgi:hypothetical protein
MNNEIKKSIEELASELAITGLLTGNRQAQFLANTLSLALQVSENELHSQIYAQKMIEFIEKVNFVEGNIPVAVHLVTECNTGQN